MKTKPVVKVGDYCRINSKRLEGKVVSVEDKTITVKTIGFGEEFSLEASDIFPSLGKEAREAQAIKAMSGLIWNVGDKCRVVKESGLKAAKIFSIDKDGEGRQYAILGFDNLDEDSMWMDELEKPLQKTPAIKDLCRAMWSEDKIVYESTIKDIQKSEGKDYCTVQFLYYGNEDSVWCDELLESHGEAARQKQKKEAGIEDAPAVASEPVKSEPTEVKPSAKKWKEADKCRSFLEGEELEGTIKAIHNNGTATVHFVGRGKEQIKDMSEIKPSAGKEAREKQRAEKASKIANEIPWKQGMFCRATFSEDGIEYEGLVKSIEENEGNPYAVVKYLGYGNEESIWIKDLKQTAGEESRETQMKESQPEITDPFWKSGLMCKFKSEKDGTEQQGLVCTLALNDKEEKIAKVRVGEDDNLIDVLLTSLEKVVVDGKNSEFENWTLGDDCRALFEVDGLEYEGKVEELKKTDDGDKYAVVRFYGYGDTQSVWIANLMKSHGKAAKDKQINEALGDIPPKKSDEDKPKETPQEKPAQEKAAQEKPVQEKPAPVEVKQENLSNGIQEEKSIINGEWKINDYCRSVCKFDGLEHEVQIVELHPQKAHLVRVKIIGLDKVEVMNKADLKASDGVAARQAQVSNLTPSQVSKPTEEVKSPAKGISATSSPIEKNSPAKIIENTSPRDQLNALKMPHKTNGFSRQVKIVAAPEIPNKTTPTKMLSTVAPNQNDEKPGIAHVNGDANNNLPEINELGENMDKDAKIAKLVELLQMKDIIIAEMRKMNTTLLQEKEKMVEESHNQLLNYIKKLEDKIC